MSVNADRIQIKRGESQTLTVTFVTADSYYANPTNPALWVPIDITNDTVIFVVKLSINNPDTMAQINLKNSPGEHLTPASGKTQFILTPTITLGFPVVYKNSQYVWEAWLLDASGNGKATMTGTFQVSASVLQTPSL